MPDPTGRVSHIHDFHRGFSWKPAARMASTGNLTLSGLQTIDGVVGAAEDIVLVKDNTTGSQNGLYWMKSGAWVRHGSMDQDGTTAVPAEEVLGSVVYVIAGTANGGTFWRNTNTTAPTLGSTSLTFSQWANSLTNPMTTKGDIIVGDTGGTAIRKAVGSDTQVLTADSASTGGIKWAAAGSGTGALVFLEAHTASASATLDFTSFISSTYDTYMFKFVSILPATSTAILYMRMGTGGGPTYDTGANYGSQLLRHNFNASAVSGADSAANQIALTTAWLSAGNHPIAGSIDLYDPQNTSLFKFLTGKFVYPDSGISNMASSDVAGQYNSVTAVTAVRFFMSSGNITSGTIRVYGVSKS